MDYIKIQKKNATISYFIAPIFAIAAMGMWFRVIPVGIGSIMALVGVGLYAFILREAFAALASGGEDRLIELVLKDKKSEADVNEIKSLESMFNAVKPISSRMPEEVSHYRFTRLHDLEQKLKAKQKPANPA